jgi:predicted transcriptional regulator
MKRAIIQVRAEQDASAVLESMGRDFVDAWKGAKATDPIATFTFSSPTQLFWVISPKRWELIEHLQRIGPSSIRGLSRSLERDIRRVHDDVTALIERGIIERDDDGKVLVPFDVIHADFDLRAVA